MICNFFNTYQFLVNWTERLSKERAFCNIEYLAFVLRIGINNFLSLQSRTLDLPVNLVLIVSTWKYSMLPVLEVFNLLKLLPHLHLEAFLEGDQSCRSNSEQVVGWAERWEIKAEPLPATADATNFTFALK